MFRQRKSTEHMQSGRRQTELPSSKDTKASVRGDAAIRKKQMLWIKSVSSWFLQACCCGPSLFGLGMFLFMSTRGRYLAKTWQKWKEGAELWTVLFHVQMSYPVSRICPEKIEITPDHIAAACWWSLPSENKTKHTTPHLSEPHHGAKP